MNFYNPNAFQMCVWSYQENDRIKASKIYRVACRMEERYRKYHDIPPTSPYRTTNSVIFPRSENMAKLHAKMGEQ